MEPSVQWGSTSVEESDAVLFKDDLDEEVSNVISSGNVELISKMLLQLAKKSNSQQRYNAQLLNKILKVQGNIQVCCRIRPLSQKEIEESEIRTFALYPTRGH